MIGQWLGYLTGLLAEGGEKAWPYIRKAAIIAIMVLLVPPVTRYWLNNANTAAVPVSAIVAMICASLLLLSFAAVVYVAFLFLSISVRPDRLAPVQFQRGLSGIPPNRMQGQSTGGTFIPHSDEQAWAAEQIDILKKTGAVTDTDAADLEEMVKHLTANIRPNGAAR